MSSLYLTQVFDVWDSLTEAGSRSLHHCSFPELKCQKLGGKYFNISIHSMCFVHVEKLHEAPHISQYNPSIHGIFVKLE